MTIVTREMIGAAHDVMLAKCDFVLSAGLLERIYLAMDAKRYNVHLVGRRPSEEAARAAIEAWLDEHAPGYPEYSLCEDGEKSWAFWITWHDTTSYLHWNGRIEWLGGLGRCGRWRGWRGRSRRIILNGSSAAPLRRPWPGRPASRSKPWACGLQTFRK